MTIRSQNITKLKPMKSPRSPPQSATNDRFVYAQASFLMVTFGVPKLNQSLVEFTFWNPYAVGGSTIFYTNIIFLVKVNYTPCIPYICMA